MQFNMTRQPFTLLIHIALVIILTGAIVTYFDGIQGELAISENDGAVTGFTKSSGPGNGRFPFTVRLESADIDFYPGTTTPRDFHSHLEIDGKQVTVSMNKVAEVDGWRFYQSGISPGATRLSISHDPWGTGITYTGYALLFIGMAGFFFQRNTPWRSLLKTSRKAAAAILFLTALDASAASTTPLPAMQRPLASNMGKAYVYWNDRICPLQTMARDVSLKLYGSHSYRGLTPEQVLSGWLFYFDTWERDFNATQPLVADNAKKQKLHGEREALIRWLGTGEAFRIYPYRAADGHTEWLSLTGRRPSQMELGQWEFMQSTMPKIKGLLLKGHNIAANDVITQLIEGQIRYAGRENLPSETRMQAERIYNRYATLLVPAVLSLLCAIFYLFIAIKGCDIKKGLRRSVAILVGIMLLYIVTMLGLLWWIGGHMPLSNGPEMMLFMSFLALAGALVCKNMMLRGAFLTVAAMTLGVGVMGGRSPRIDMLMPVLASPLLSIHVMLAMTAYVFFLIMAILSAIGLLSKHDGTTESLCRTNRIILVPAVFLLAAAIFIGAIWANQSWGRYWGWDPKETCALAMLLIYAVPVHWGARRLKAFRKPKVLHWYLLLAVLSVIFTYFGANYFLSGLHSYA